MEFTDETGAKITTTNVTTTSASSVVTRTTHRRTTNPYLSLLSGGGSMESVRRLVAKFLDVPVGAEIVRVQRVHGECS